jgi:hypothetical protein
MPTYGDRVKETTLTVGTGTITLAGAATGYQAFSAAFATGETAYYCITDGTHWEVGQGTFTLIGLTLSRDSVVASSNAGALVSFPGPTSDVFNTLPATAAVSMVKASLATQQVIRVAPDDNMMFAQELTLNGTAEVQCTGTSELIGVA